jgi:DNA-binding response OmpR family regulator
MGKDLVLMVDDELDNRVMMRYFLESWGYEVELAANGEEALQKVAARRPALVLLDLEMPVMDGFEACHRLKEDPRTEHIPVIMFTGLESTADKVKGIRRGADDYVVKTVDPEEIQARVEMILRRSRRYDSQHAAGKESEDAVLSGSLSDKSFPEAFQLAMAYGQSGTLVVKDDSREGRVYLADGTVTHAECGRLTGENAFFELAIWRKGHFSYVVGERAPRVTIGKAGTALLMEATRCMDEWNLISSRIPSFDAVPHRIASAITDAVSLGRLDWRVASAADGLRTVRRIADEIGADLYEVGRALFGLVSLGAVSFEPERGERDSFFDAVPELRTDPRGDEPYELSAIQWKLLAWIDGRRDLGVLTHLVGLAPRKMAEQLKELAERGFIRLNKRSSRAEAAPAAGPSLPLAKDLVAPSESGRIEAFTPRIRAIGLD